MADVELYSPTASKDLSHGCVLTTTASDLRVLQSLLLPDHGRRDGTSTTAVSSTRSQLLWTIHRRMVLCVQLHRDLSILPCRSDGSERLIAFEPCGDSLGPLSPYTCRVGRSFASVLACHLTLSTRWSVSARQTIPCHATFIRLYGDPLLPCYGMCTSIASNRVARVARTSSSTHSPIL